LRLGHVDSTHQIAIRIGGDGLRHYTDSAKAALSIIAPGAHQVP